MYRTLAVCLTLATLHTLCAAGEPKMSIPLRSSAFADGQPIDRKYTEDGRDLSPPLSWSDVPPGTRELALVVDDPDAPTAEPWVHWLIYKIPAEVTSLSAGITPQGRLEEPPGALQGRNSWRSGQTLGYRGPAPPRGSGTHHYRFRIYALDAPLDVEPGIDKRALEKAMQGHILGQGQLVGTYSR